MVDSNKISSLTRTWPTPPVNKDRHDKDQNKKHKNKKDDKPKTKNEEPRDPGDTIIDEYV